MKKFEVSIGKKFKYLAMAIDELEKRGECATWKTDLIGLACQYGATSKLKPEDFNYLLFNLKTCYYEEK